MIDTHAHLQYDCFASNLEGYLERAVHVGITHHIVPGIDIPSSRESIALAQAHSATAATVGIHPYLVLSIVRGETTLESLQSEFEKLVAISATEIVAIGECGLDYHYFKREHIHKDLIEKHKSLQKSLLMIQVAAAQKYNLPLILHTRDSEEETVSLMQKQLKNLSRPILFHCCPPNDQLLTFALEHSFYIGVDGDVTYDKVKQEFVKRVPLDLLLLETDSPYLMPEPVRRQTRYPNEPAHLIYVAQKVAELKGVPVETIDTRTTQNAKAAFSLT